jgi:hypothetical protein
MKNLLYLSIFAALFFSSCDCTNSFDGTVVDENGHPMKDVNVHYLIDGKIQDQTVTDSAGKFTVTKISGICNPLDNDIVLTKKGYASLILNEHDEIQKAGHAKYKDTVVLKPSTESFSAETLLELSSVHNFFNFFNIIVLVVNGFSIIYIFLVRERKEYWWVILFAIINPVITLNLDSDSVSWKFIGIVADPNFTNRPWIINICVPIIAIIFWIRIKYLKKKEK